MGSLFDLNKKAKSCTLQATSWIGLNFNESTRGPEA
jgi:hypothetical protein